MVRSSPLPCDLSRTCFTGGRIPLTSRSLRFVRLAQRSSPRPPRPQILIAEVVDDGGGTLTATYETAFPGDYLVYVEEGANFFHLLARFFPTFEHKRFHKPGHKDDAPRPHAPC